MGVSSDLLGRLGGSRVASGLTDFFAMILGFFNMLFKPVEAFVKLIVENSLGISRMTWGLDLAIAVAALLYVFMTEVTDIPTAATGDEPGQFAVTEVAARSVVFASGLSLTLVTLSAVMGYLFATGNAPGAVAGFFEGLSFSEKYDIYLATFKHGIHSMLAVAIAMLWGLNDDRTIRWVGSTDGDDDTTLTFLLLLFIALMVSKFLSEVKHGEDAREMVVKAETIGDSVGLKSDHKFKHARGAALTVSTGLLVYMLANADLGDGFFSFLGGNMVALSLSVYILVVSLERIAGRREWVVGGAGGLVVTGAVSFWNLIAAGMALAEDKSQSAVVVALGAIFLDAMRVGYGQSVPEKAVVSDVRKVFLRLLQALAGIIAFVYVTKVNSGDHAAVSPLLFGVALASALVKVVGVSYIGKDMFKTSTEHHFRELASTGLLLSSAYLWSHPLDDSSSDTVAVLFFVIGILCRFLDSVLDFMMTGKDALKYISWDKDEEDEGVESPTSDNPRTWLTLLSLATSLAFAAMAMHEKFDHIKLGSNATDASGAEVSRPLDKELSDSMIVAVTFISIHVAVVLIGIASDSVPQAAIGALSRSKLIRFAVTTTVLSSLAVASGRIGFDDVGTLSSDSAQTDIISALVAYLFADVVGRELL